MRASRREKNARLRAEVRDLKEENAALASRAETLQAEYDRMRATRSVLSKALDKTLVGAQMRCAVHHRSG